VSSVLTSLSRFLTSATRKPTASPIAIPPAASPKNSSPVCDAETLAPTAAPTATLYARRAVASLNRLSPSRTFTSRRGAPTRRITAVAAAGSVGETIAPRTNDIAQGRPITSWAMRAIATAVAITSPIAFSEITRASARSVRRSTKNAEA
jgi:hypothetical protein